MLEFVIVLNELSFRLFNYNSILVNNKFTIIIVNNNFRIILSRYWKAYCIVHYYAIIVRQVISSSLVKYQIIKPTIKYLFVYTDITIGKQSFLQYNLYDFYSFIGSVFSKERVPIYVVYLGT